MLKNEKFRWADSVKSVIIHAKETFLSRLTLNILLLERPILKAQKNAEGYPKTTLMAKIPKYMSSGKRNEYLRNRKKDESIIKSLPINIVRTLPKKEKKPSFRP